MNITLLFQIIECGRDDINYIPSYVPFKADIWSLGVSLYVMLARKYPYEVPSDTTEYHQLIQGMKRGVVTKKNLKKKFESDKLASLLCGMLEFDPNARFTVRMVLDHSWLKT